MPAVTTLSARPVETPRPKKAIAPHTARHRFLKDAMFLLAPEEQRETDHEFAENARRLMRSLPPTDQEVVSDSARELLVACGWKNKPVNHTTDMYVFSSADGLTFAYFREAEGSELFRAQENGEPAWIGGFFYCEPYPEDEAAKRAYVEEYVRRVYFYNESNPRFLEAVDQHLRIYPGIQVAQIDVVDRKMMLWSSMRANRHSEAFKVFEKIFEFYFEALAETDGHYGYAMQFLDDSTNPHWQWSKLSNAELQERLDSLALTATSEKEIRLVLLEELGYPSKDADQCLRVWSPSEDYGLLRLCTRHNGFTIHLIRPDLGDMWWYINDPNHPNG